MNYLTKYYSALEQKIIVPSGSTEFDLVAFRFCYCLILTFQLVQSFQGYVLKFDHAPFYIDHSLLTLLKLVDKPSIHLYLSLIIICIVSLILLAFGFKSRWTALLAMCTFTGSHLFFYAMQLVPSSKYVFHSLNIIPFILLGFVVIPIKPLQKNIENYVELKRSSALYSYVVILLCFSYSAALFNRLLTMPVQWLSGEFLSNYFAHYGYVMGVELSQKLSGMMPICLLLSWGTVFFELGCWSLLFAGKHRLFLIASGVVFHVMIDQTGFANFVDWFGFSYLIFIPYSKIFLWIKAHFERMGWVQ